MKRLEVEQKSKKQSKKKQPITKNVQKTPKSKQISSESSKSTEKEISHGFLTPNNEIITNQSKPLEVQHSTKVTTTSEKLHLSSKSCSGNESKTELNLKPTPTYNLRDAITGMFTLSQRITRYLSNHIAVLMLLYRYNNFLLEFYRHHYKVLSNKSWSNISCCHSIKRVDSY